MHDKQKNYMEQLHNFARQATVQHLGTRKSIEIHDACVADQERNWHTFKPLFRQTCMQTNNHSNKWLHLYQMIIENTYREYTARMLRHIKTSDAMLEIMNKIGVDLYCIVLQSYEHELARTRTRAEYYRNLYLSVPQRSLHKQTTEHLNTPYNIQTVADRVPNARKHVCEFIKTQRQK